MTKPILIDALHICMGGGLMILNHLVNNLVQEKVDFVLLKDSRCPVLQMENYVKHMEVLTPTFSVRRNFYKHHKNDFRAVLCFGNIPPYIKMNVPVYTYMHNVSLLKIPKDYSIKKKFLSYLKRLVLVHFGKNTSTWIVQTSNTANLINKVLKRPEHEVLEFPFYHIPAELTETVPDIKKDYVFIGDYTNAKGHDYLVDAWVKLHRMGINPTLHLTVTDPVFCRWIEAAQAEGTNIVNHGLIPFRDVIKLYQMSKATVYPSLNESLGLGIIEAMAAGCDVIGCDLPYLHSVCQPSETFNACDSEDIVKAVLRNENGDSPKTRPLIKDKIKEFIAFINQ